MCVSYVFVSTTREPDSSPKPSDHPYAYLNQSLEILKRDKNFQIFIGIRMLSQFAGMGFAFYVIYAVRQFGMSDAAVGIMVAILLIGQVVSESVNGPLGRSMESSRHDESRCVGRGLERLARLAAQHPRTGFMQFSFSKRLPRWRSGPFQMH